MPRIPRDGSLESTLASNRDPYRFIAKRCRRYQSDLFETRLLLQRTICMTGPQAAELFYDPRRMNRRGAPPARIAKTLFGQGGVQSLDDEAHRHRKRMFMSLMAPEQIGRLVETTAGAWRAYARRWAAMDEVVLYNELHPLLTHAVCAWAGVLLAESELGRRTEEITALFEYAGSVGPKHWWSRLARRRANRWIENIVAQIRAGRLHPPEGTAAHVIAWHRDLNGELLSPRVAAWKC